MNTDKALTVIAFLISIVVLFGVFTKKKEEVDYVVDLKPKAVANKTQHLPIKPKWSPDTLRCVYKKE